MANKKLYVIFISLIAIIVVAISGWWFLSAKYSQGHKEFIISIPTSFKTVLVPLIEKYDKNSSVDIIIKEGNGEQVQDLLEERALDVAITYFPVKNIGDNLQSQSIGVMPYIFVLNAKCGIKSLTTEAIRDVFTGKINNWQQIGGNDCPVILVHPNYMNAVPYYLKQQFLPNDKFADSSLFLEQSGDVLAKVNKIDGAIGYMTIMSFKQDVSTKYKENIVIATVNGLLPNLATIEDFSYAAVMPINVIHQKRFSGKEIDEFVRQAREAWQKTITEIKI